MEIGQNMSAGLKMSGTNKIVAAVIKSPLACLVCILDDWDHHFIQFNFDFLQKTCTAILCCRNTPLLQSGSHASLYP